MGGGEFVKLKNLYHLIDDWYAVVDVITGGAEQRSSAIVLEEQMKRSLSQIICRTDIGPFLQ